MSNLTAAYTSPDSSPHTISHPLPASTPDPSTDARIAHLAALQSSMKTLQADLNAFLTQKMDDDKAAGVAKAGKVDDAKEEENYGEEIVDAD
ncbi:hypothetical protein K505DRAFT_52343 [Melanomma pulvis-pyrius CBS 109.77]|uniref:EKC/KEOPS complex subunit GON7 n=1 Tax=Melanomma pulvis-pyrius CBS 109.77 TaxID=1314802 RepID=A0A6A6X9U7_9PLEO|nr:hypothetical protein K505DRAFT_52343 [Melanomma pulvis-pyrius CBS 109.77]